MEDRHRPRYHFLPPANWMNDPNGLIQWRGLYHLFYQYNPNGAFWGTMHWGHASSPDLVHWTHLPVALAPTPGGPDEDGVFSGCAVDNDGVATFVYTGVRGEAQLPCIATSRDDDLVHWEKYAGNPVVAAPPAEVDTLIFRDHAVWRQDGTWYQLVGSGIRNEGGAALLYRSPNLIEWEYLHPIYVGDKDQREPVWTGMNWECPSFADLDSGHVLMMSVMDERTPYYVAYLSGEYRDLRFSPRHGGLVDHGWPFYAPQVFVDDAGRRVMFGWLKEERSEAAQRAAGWSGVQSLPRVLSLLPSGELGQEPAPEVEALRREHLRLEDVPVGDVAVEMPEGASGDSLELLAEFEPGDTGLCGLIVRRSPEGEEETVIRYDGAVGELTLDAGRSSLDEDAGRQVRTARLELEPGEQLRLRVFLDRSVVEVFANGRCCITERIYPMRPDSLGVRVFGRDGARVRAVDVWGMAEA